MIGKHALEQDVAYTRAGAFGQASGVTVELCVLSDPR